MFQSFSQISAYGDNITTTRMATLKVCFGMGWFLFFTSLVFHKNVIIQEKLLLILSFNADNYIQFWSLWYL